MPTRFEFDWFTQKDLENGEVSLEELMLKSNRNYIVRFKRSTHNNDGSFKGHLPYRDIGNGLNIHYLENNRWLTFDEIYTRHIQPEILPDMPPIFPKPPEPFYILRSLVELIMVGYVEIRVDEEMV